MHAPTGTALLLVLATSAAFPWTLTPHRAPRGRPVLACEASTPFRTDARIVPTPKTFRAPDVQDAASVIKHELRSPAVEMEHGRDPRFAPAAISGSSLLRSILARPAGKPKAATASASPTITPIVSLAEFETALQRSTAAERIVVIKFYSPSCRSCLTIKPLYDKLSQGPLGDSADFFEVDTVAARALVKLAGIERAPTVFLFRQARCD